MAPRILLRVMCSPNSPYEIANVKTMQILLHKNALFKGMNVKTFCHKTAYKPKVAITHPKKRMYGKDRKECCDASFVKIPVPE